MIPGSPGLDMMHTFLHINNIIRGRYLFVVEIGDHMFCPEYHIGF